MPKIKYTPKRFGAKALSIIETANQIITEYQGQGFDLTLRQLYYQFVSRDVIPNTQRDYKNLGAIINDARLAGLVDWESIIDRTRNLVSNSHWDSPGQIVAACAKQFQIDKWADQDIRPEVWIEKDALVGVIERVCKSNDVAFFSCRGYTSQSEMWSAAQRLLGYEAKEQRPYVIHLGDHDPSGKDMTRDIEDRLALFGVDLTLKRVALNMDQIRKFRPPPNPAKITDSRARNYIKEFGGDSWELDALEPKMLANLIEETILSLRDESKWKKQLKLERSHKARLETVSEELDENGD